MTTVDLGSVEAFQVLVENFPDMIHSVDSEGRIVYVNKMASQLLGYTTDELLGMNIRQLYPREILEAVEAGFNEVKQNTSEKQVESQFLAKDGTRIPVELRTLSIRDAQNVFKRTFTVSRDLRKFKEMQDHLIHAGRLAAIGELAAGVVHDLNNPLTAIVMVGDLMKRSLENTAATSQEFRDQTGQFAEIISDSASVMSGITTHLRDFARGVKEQHHPVDLFEPINDALFIMDHRLRHANVMVSQKIAKNHHWIVGDRNQMVQIFLNLIGNACDAMDERETRALTIEVAPVTEKEKSFWCCTVSDTGTGISKANQERVFASFFTTKPRGKGTGLGLSIVSTIVREHGGSIRLDSEVGQGTTFSILLPCREA
jgi:two-component system, NtrC family, sensor kinase